jgi:hypothetical protein
MEGSKSRNNYYGVRKISRKSDSNTPDILRQGRPAPATSTPSRIHINYIGGGTTRDAERPLVSVWNLLHL